MAQVRKNPLPAGRYWLYVGQGTKGKEIFELWLKKNTDIITVEQQQNTDPLEPLQWPTESQYGNVPGQYGKGTVAPEGDIFYLWSQKEPAIWPRGCGFPNSADPSVKSSSDVTIRPPTPTAADVARDLEETAAELARKAKSALTYSFDFGTTVLILGALYYFANKRKFF